MNVSTVIALIGLLAVSPPVRAEFQIAPPSASASTTYGGSGTIVLSSESVVSTQPQVARAPTMFAIPVAHGFGKEVPLAFATRQIVPAKVKVTFGPGVDYAALVDCKGGRPWTETLKAAVRPVGLRVVVRWKAVSIIRA